MSEHKNLFITILLSTMVMLGWQYFYEMPRLEQNQEIKRQAIEETVAKEPQKSPPKELSREIAIAASAQKRVSIDNGKIKGSFNLQGFKIDDLALLDFNDTIDPSSNHVILLAPENTNSSYFAEFGWKSDDQELQLPNQHTHWQADKTTIKANDPVTLSWISPQNIIFKIILTLDDDYLFTIKQIVENNSTNSILLAKYGQIYKKLDTLPASQAILHEGAIGTSQNILFEESYSGLSEKEDKKFQSDIGDWLGITDKYWLTSLIPQHTFETTLQRETSEGKNLYQVTYSSKEEKIIAGGSNEDKVYFFAGAKNLKNLDYYAKEYHINLFDRAVDFGWFYFLTKPIFLAIQFLDSVTGNFGVAILLLTVLIKLIMYPLANKSYHSMNKMKALNPQLIKLKERYEDDKAQLNKETMELYKKEGVNPLSGCLPLLLQIPVFFSLYKVLFVTIEMRHAPFFGWIHDLSAPDPTTIFNLFGLIPWNPPSFLLIGAWPIIMAFTMYLQQKMSPQPTDPVQAQVMKFLPLIFVFMFGSFPAGLVIYWAWNNILSVLQQWVIDKKPAKE